MSADQIESGDGSSKEPDKSKPDQERAGYREQDECREARNRDEPHGDAQRLGPGDLAVLIWRAKAPMRMGASRPATQANEIVVGSLASREA
jgi:hypothetical protein